MDMSKTVTRLGTALVAASFACAGAAIAQPKPGGTPAAPHISAPAPHFSAPAPHFSAPAAHFNAPTTHFSAAPHINTPHFAARTPRTGVGAFTPRGHAFASRSLARQTIHRPALARHALQGRLAGRSVTRSASRNLAGRNLTRRTTRTARTLTRSTTRGRALARSGRRAGPTNGQVANGRKRPSGAQLAALSRPLGARNRNFADRHRFFDRRRHFARGGFIGWFGPVFWPYAYDDFFDYAFWPEEYDDYGFWAYAYDDLIDSVFWNPGSEDIYASVGQEAGTAGRRTQQAYRAAMATCRAESPGLTRWPTEEIAQVVQPTRDQQKLLDQLKSASDQAAKLLRTACPANQPSTPLGRLDAMAQRLNVMLQALDTVRPALADFYASLTDEQKARFNAMRGQPGGTAAGAGATEKNASRLCGGQAPGAFSDQAIGRIEREVRPNDRQKVDLDALRDASAKAAEELRGACPTQTPITPVARLDAMSRHVKAMLDAIDTVRPALAKFYDSLSDEQKAHFNIMSPRQASNQ
jgi:hypothetical protein